MSNNNIYSPLPSKVMPSEDKLNSLVTDMCYARVNDLNVLPPEMKSNGLTQKFNSVVFAASASDTGICYTAIGLRPDKNNTVIDEHPFVFYYDKYDSSKNFWGIIHHGNWDGRTFPDKKVEAALSASGLTAEFTYKQIPPGSSGLLLSLSANGMLNGFIKQQEIVYQQIPEDPKK